MKKNLLILSTAFLLLCFAESSDAKVIPNAYIVQVADTADVHKIAGDVARFTGGNVAHVYTKALWGFAIRGVPAGIKKADILARAGVVLVEPDLEVYAFLRENDFQSLPTGVDRINADRNPIANIDGVDERVDVDIAIIDTGIQGDHPDLNVHTGQNFSSGAPSWEDGHGHGTHVAGIAAALDNNIGVVGVAPGARLWAVKVLKTQGTSFLSNVIAGVDWVTQNADQIEVANMSLGSTGTSTLFRTAIQNSVAAGVVYIVAAGNDSKDVYGDDGLFNTSDDFIPAAYPEVATISAMADSDGQPGGTGSSTSAGVDDSFASFSNFSGSVVVDNPVTSPGAAIDLLMPGVDILSTVPVDTGQTVNAQWDSNDHQANEIDGSAFGDVNGLIFSCGLGNGIGETNTCPDGVAGNIAHIRRGDSTFADKVAHAESKGAIGVIISNNEPGNFLGTLNGSSSLVVVSVSQADGDELELISGAGTPGSVTVIIDDYDIFSGTSMSSPHAAGLAALDIAENGRALDANGVYAIRQRLINSGVSQDSPQGLAILNDPDENLENIGYYIPPGDFTGNGFVDFEDLAILVSFWLQNEPSVDIAPAAGDGIINFLDFASLAENWN